MDERPRQFVVHCEKMQHTQRLSTSLDGALYSAVSLPGRQEGEVRQSFSLKNNSSPDEMKNVLILSVVPIGDMSIVNFVNCLIKLCLLQICIYFKCIYLYILKH